SMDRSLSPVVLRLVRGGQSKSWTMLPGIGGVPRFAKGTLSARTAATTISDTFVISNPGFDSARVVAQAGSSALDTAWLAARVELAGIPWNGAITYGTLKDARDNKAYRTVRIGSQTCMAQNLNYKPIGADSGNCYTNKADSCTKYGRLYGWHTAMAGQLASPYLPRPATGICPSGWHLPSQTEWGDLTKFVGPAPKGARDLKSTAGWTIYGNGSDAYGFRALPGGSDTGHGAFAYGGRMGFWWTSSAAAQDSSSISMTLEPTSYTIASTKPLARGYSVRCLQGALAKPKDTILTSLVISGGRGRSLAPAFHPGTLVYRDTVPWTIASVGVAAKTLDTSTASVWINGVKTNNVNVPVGANGTTTLVKVVVRSQDGDSLKYQVSVYRPVAPPTFGIPWKTGITYGTLYDARDGNVYRTVGRWMAQNLNYKVAGVDSGSCVSNSLDSCAKYGRLYQWPTVMKGAVSSSEVPSGVQGICPGGWHVPSEGEWNELLVYSGPTISAVDLKSLAGWPVPYTTNGTDGFGFRALPAVGPHAHPGFMAMEEAGWWSTTSVNLVNGGNGNWPDGTYPVLLSIDHGFDYPNSGPHPGTTGFPLRCVKN
ncbi:MAG: FISUMP domain-containing protein, partial [Fibrobacterota bacterium]